MIKINLNKLSDSHESYLREFIETLEEIERRAIEHFGKEWPNC